MKLKGTHLDQASEMLGYNDYNEYLQKNQTINFNFITALHEVMNYRYQKIIAKIVSGSAAIIGILLTVITYLLTN
jgi:hypothetical protein